MTFPDPTAASGIFASFSLPGGDSVTLAATGLGGSDFGQFRIGGGLAPDGTPDAFYLFTYGPRVINACDVNLDNFLDIRDVQFMISQALGGIPAGNDLNQDGRVNLVDSQIETNWVLYGCPGLATLRLANPNLGVAGQMKESVDLIGQSTHWVQGATTASFGGAGSPSPTHRQLADQRHRGAQYRSHGCRYHAKRGPYNWLGSRHAE